MPEDFVWLWYANHAGIDSGIQKAKQRQKFAERSQCFAITLKPFGAASRMDRPAILLIDDNAVQAAIRQTILKRAGYHVIAALSPVRALEQFRQNSFPERIGLVITDHLMPEMSGSRFTRELRAMSPAMPVMVISGLEEAEDEYEGLNVTFRMKPLLPDTLLENVDTLLPMV